MLNTVSRARSVITIYLLSLGALLSACSPWDRLDVVSHTLYQPLAEHDLNAFEQRIAHLKRRGASGDALIIATQWLYLLHCHPIPFLESPQHPLWKALYASLYLEETRTQNELGQLGSLLQTSSKLKIDPQVLPSELWMTWPKNVEGWPDEAPLYVQLPRVCQGRIGRINFDLSSGVILPSITAQRVNKIVTAPSEISNKANYIVQEVTKLLLPSSTTLQNQFWRQSARLGWLLQAITHLNEVNLDEYGTPETQTLIQSWVWWLRFDLAQVLSQTSQVDLGWSPPQQHPWAGLLLFRFACKEWDLLQTAPPPPIGRNGLSAHAQASLMRGLCLEYQGEHLKALELWRNPYFSTLDPQSIELVYYHRLRLLSTLGMWKEAVTLRDYLPPPQSRLYPAYIYALGKAHQNAGDEAGLMALSTQVFRDRSWRRDPFLRGLFYLFVRALTRYDFESRVIELLEDLGPRFETYDRVLVFAEVSLDEAQSQQAKEAATWLLDHGARGEQRYYLYTLLAHAALLELDQARFSQALRKISGLKSKSLQAIPKGRRGQFFKERDLALTRLLQRLLPLVAEWPQTRARSEWLELIISEIQTFLRTRPETRSRSELTALYRAGKSMLDLRSHLAYAEKIGRSTPASLILGQVRVQATNVSPFEPREVTLRLERPWALTLLPSGPLSPYQWSLEWPQYHP